MYCTQCGLQVADNARQCPSCGYDVSAMREAKQEFAQKLYALGKGYQDPGPVVSPAQDVDPGTVANGTIRQQAGGAHDLTGWQLPGAPAWNAYAGGYPSPGYPVMQKPAPNPMGLASGIMGIATIVIWVLCVVVSVASEVSAGARRDSWLLILGLLLLVNLVLIVTGLIMGLIALRRPHAARAWAWTGVILNGLSVLFLLLLVAVALFT